MTLKTVSWLVNIILISLLFMPAEGGGPALSAREREISRVIKQYGYPKAHRYLSTRLFKDNHILAYYGHPRSRIMGIVGRMSKEKLADKLDKHVVEYDRLNGERGVVPAIYLIYATCQPEGRIAKMSSKLLQEYIDFTLERGYLLYIDHQIGTTSLRDMMDTLLPFLKYPHVHLAFDVEWRTSKPMKEIGFINGRELNKLQKWMHNYMDKNNIPGVRQLVFHQFHKKMVQNPSAVKSEFDDVLLVHSTSGWGPPTVKLATHARNAKATTMPYKAFKLWFFYSTKSGVHFDKPLMSPADVLALDPNPGLIIYQ